MSESTPEEVLNEAPKGFDANEDFARILAESQPPLPPVPDDLLPKD